MPQIGEEATVSALSQIILGGPLRVRVHSLKRFTFLQGNWIGTLLALLILVSTLIALTIEFRFTLRPVEGRDRVQIVQSTHVLGLQWHTKDHGEITVINFVEASGKTQAHLEIRSPGRSEWIRLHDMSHALSQIEDTAAQIMSHQITTPQTLHFHIPIWLTAIAFALSTLLLTWTRPSSVQFDADHRRIILSDWGGLIRHLLTPSQLARISVEDGDPQGWRQRAHLHQRWLIVAHPHRGRPRPLATTTDRAFAAQWAAHISFFLNSATLPNVSPGEYTVWDHESPL